MTGPKMRPNVSRAARWVLACCVGAVHLVVYQNCGTYEAANGMTSVEETASACVGLACGVDAESIEIVSGNSEYKVVRPAPGAVRPAACDATYCVDVAGYCNSGGYPDSVFYFELQNGTQQVMPATRTTASCDHMGRFRILIVLPPNFQYTAHNLFLTMKAIDDKGAEIDNPRGTNRKVVPLSPL